MTLEQPHTPPGGSPAEEATRLSGNINVFHLVFTVVAYNAPMFVFLGFLPVAILLGNGVGTPVTFLVCGAVVAMLAKGFITMGLTMQQPGGFYSFISAGLGKVAGLGAGFAAMICYFVGGFGGYLLGGDALTTVVSGVFGGPDVKWWVGSGLMFVAVVVLGHFNIGLSARVLAYFLVVELIFMVIYVGAVVVQGGADGLGLDSFQPDNIFSGSIGIALMFGIGIFGGFEATVIFREEVRSPERTIPVATYSVVALLAVLYAVVAWAFINAEGAKAVMAVLNNDGLGAATGSVQEFEGSFASDVATILLFTSSFALALAAHNITSRYVFNLSADRILPHQLSEVHHRYASPHRSSLLVGILSGAGLLYLLVASIAPLDAYAPVAGLYSYTLVLLLVLVAAAVLVYLSRGKVEGGTTLTKAMTAVSLVVLVIVLFLATKNFDLLAATSSKGTTILLLIVYGLVAAGVVWGLRLRSSRPDVYARIGRDDPNSNVEEAHRS